MIMTLKSKPQGYENRAGEVLGVEDLLDLIWVEPQDLIDVLSAAAISRASFAIPSSNFLRAFSADGGGPFCKTSLVGGRSRSISFMQAALLSIAYR